MSNDRSNQDSAAALQHAQAVRLQHAMPAAYQYALNVRHKLQTGACSWQPTMYMSTTALQAIIRRSCWPVTCWEQFAEMAVAVLRDMLDALPAGSSVSKQITEKVCSAHLS